MYNVLWVEWQFKKNITVMLHWKIQEKSKKNNNKIYLFKFTINGIQNISLISQWWVGRVPTCKLSLTFITHPLSIQRSHSIEDISRGMKENTHELHIWNKTQIREKPKFYQVYKAFKMSFTYFENLHASSSKRWSQI